jgi:asparagine synthase (glutamine-hydrolysing)
MEIFGIYHKNDNFNSFIEAKKNLIQINNNLFYAIKDEKQQKVYKKEMDIQYVLKNDWESSSPYQGETILSNCSNSQSLLISYNTSKNILQIQTDHFATIPLYYYEDENIFIFSNLFKNIVELIPRNKNTDLRVAHEIIDFGYALYDSTIVAGIQDLPYGCKITVDKGNTYIDRYWDFNINEVDNTIDVVEIQAQLAVFFKKAVGRSLAGSQKAIIPLSGGLDSRAIFAEAYETIGPDNILLYTVGKHNTQDIEIAKNISKRFGVEHALCYLPSEDNKIYSEMDWSQYFRKKIKINNGLTEILPGDAPVENLLNMSAFSDSIISGYMGGELFASHLNQSMFWDISNFDDAYEKILSSQHLYLAQIANSIDNPYTAPPEYLRNKLNQYNSFAALSMHWDFSVRQQKYIKFGQITRYGDAIKPKVPFIDNELFEFICNKIPLKYKLNEQIYVAMLMKEYPAYFQNIPTTYSYGLTINAGSTKKFLYRAANKANRVLSKNIFPSNPKVNTVIWSDIVDKQKGLKHYYHNIIDRAQSSGILSDNNSIIMKRSMATDSKVAYQVGRVATVIETMDYYNLK